MKKTLFFALFVILNLSFMGNMFAQLTVELGTGTEVNTRYGAPSPYGTWDKAFRQQFLVLASELNIEGAGMGNINSIAFNVQELNNTTPMNNFRIRFKHTNQTTLSTTFETGAYSQVFQTQDFIPTVGWNTHSFTTPFIWDGSSNLLIEIVTDPFAGNYIYYNASTFYTSTPFNSSLRSQHHHANGDTATMGEVLSNRSNMKLNISALNLLDMTAISVDGPITPSVNDFVNYTVTVRNLSPEPVSDYSVKLFLDDEEINSIPGTPLDSMEFAEFEFDWIPLQTGDVTLYGKVVMLGDENPNNDLTPGLDITVVEEGLIVVHVGDGMKVNTGGQPPAPYGTSRKNFRQQFLVRSNELYGQGVSPGSITAMAFDVQSINTCGAMPNYRIRLKHTNQNELTTTFETGDYLQVFHSPDFMPEVGWNLHTFQAPFFLDGESNLLVEIVTDFALVVGQNASTYFTETDYNSAVRFESYGDQQADGYATGTVGMERSNMRIYINTEDTDDMAAMEINGPQLPNVNSPSDYVIRVMNICPDPVSNYTVKLMEVDGEVLGTASGVLLDHNEIAEITIPWTPTETGTTQIYGRVEMPGDENPLNDNTFLITITVVDEGLSVFQIGEGTEEWGLPVGRNLQTYSSTYSQMLYKADMIMTEGGHLEKIAFHWSGGAVPGTNSWTVYIGNTDKEYFETISDWIDFDSMTQVYHGIIDIPAEEMWIEIEFDSPFLYYGEDNLVIATLENNSNYYSSGCYFFNSYGDNRCSLKHSSRNNPTPEDPPHGSESNRYANIRMYFSDGPAEPVFTCSPSELDFGTISYGVLTDPMNVRVGNNGSGTIVINAEDIDFRGSQANMFRLDDSMFPLIIDGFKYAYVPIFLQGSQEGTVSANLVIAHDNEEHIIQLNAYVLEQDILAVQLGSRSYSNSHDTLPSPYSTYNGAYHQQYLIRSDELLAAGGYPGHISYLAWNLRDASSCSIMSNYRIRIKHTEQQSLSDSFEPGDYTEVLQIDNFKPMNGLNIHILDEPFFWNGVENLLIDVITDGPKNYNTGFARCYYSQTTFDSTLNAGSNNNRAFNLRPNTYIYLFPASMGAINGSITEDGMPLKNVTVSVEGAELTTTTNDNGYYSFPFVPAGTHTISASKYGYSVMNYTVEVEEDETIIRDFIMVGTPEFTVSDEFWNYGEVTVGGSSEKSFIISNAGGSMIPINSIEMTNSDAFSFTELPNLPVILRSEDYITFKVKFAPTLPGDYEATILVIDDLNNYYATMNKSNTESQVLELSNDSGQNRTLNEIILTGNGCNVMTVGNDNLNSRLPLDFYWKNSLFQTIYTYEELNEPAGIITGIKLYNNFGTTINHTPVKIWLGGTQQADLANGWISSNDMTLVFDGTVDFPSGENTISINFPDAYPIIDGENLSMLVQRPMDTTRYSHLEYFKCYTSGTNRSRNASSDSDNYNPAAMSGGNISDRSPKITFEIMPHEVGNLHGIVRSEVSTPLAGVYVTLNDRLTVTTDCNGMYYFNNLVPSNYKISFSSYGFVSQTENIIIIEDQTLELENTMTELPKVAISGIILASDTAEGMEGVKLVFTSLECEETETAMDGSFNIELYTHHTYSYDVSKEGYVSITGEIVIIDNDYDMGEITLNEIAYLPSNFFAVISPSYDSVILNWDTPTPNTNRNVSQNAVGKKQTLELVSMKNSEGRAHLGYKVWRLNSGEEESPDSWELLTPDIISGNGFVDEEWLSLPDGEYVWVLKAFYDADIMSDPLFSDQLIKSNTDGNLSGFVLNEADQSPIAGAAISIDGETEVFSEENGSFSVDLAIGPHNLSVTHTYFEDSEEISFGIWPSETTNLIVEMQSLPQVEVSGRILASDTGEGLVGVDISITGFKNYNLQTDDEGYFNVFAYADHSYDYMITKAGYVSIEGTLEVGSEAISLGDITLNEIAYLPSNISALINPRYDAIILDWEAPDPDADRITRTHDVRTATFTLSSNNDSSGRAHIGYQIWRLSSGDENSPTSWELITPETISEIGFEDNDWLSLPDGEYLWALKAIYDANIISDPIFSNELTKLNADGLLAGFILDDADESPVVSATITVDGEFTAISSETGEYSLSLAPGPHSLSVSHTYYEDSDEISFVILPSETTSLNIELESLPRVMVSGTILASDTGAGLAGVDVSITGFMDYTLETNTDGSFSVLAYAGYTYDFELSKDGYESISGAIEVGYTAFNLGEITLYEIAYLPSDLTASINDTYTAVELSWNAPDPENNLGYQIWRLSDADQDDETLWSLITPETISTTSLMDGDWASLADGDYLWATKAIYAAGVISEPIFSDALTKSNADGILAGFILDEADESPIVGALITVDDEHTALSDDTGAYTLNLVPGPHTVIVSHTYFEDSDELSFVILPDEITNLNIVLESLPQVMVNGRIIGSDTGEGLAGVDIEVTGFMDYNFQTDAAGQFSVLAYANHSYDMIASKAGYESLSGEVVLGDEPLDMGDFMLMEIAYMPTNAMAEINPIHTAVTISWDAPEPDHNEILSLSEGSYRRAQHIQNNRAAIGYSVWRLSEGEEDDESTWNLLTDEPIASTQIVDEDWLDLADGSYLWAIKAVYNAGIISDATFSNELEKEEMYGMLFGIVKRSSDQTPISGVLISIDDDTNIITDDSGYYSFLLLTGEYTITATHDDFETVTVENVFITGGENTEIDISMGTVASSDLVEVVQTELMANYPNPFNPETTISFSLMEAGNVCITIYNMRGQMIKKLVDTEIDAGMHSLVWDGKDDHGRSVSSGVYLYRMQSEGYNASKKMIMMK